MHLGIAQDTTRLANFHPYLTFHPCNISNQLTFTVFHSHNHTPSPNISIHIQALPTSVLDRNLPRLVRVPIKALGIRSIPRLSNTRPKPYHQFSMSLAAHRFQETENAQGVTIITNSQALMASTHIPPITRYIHRRMYLQT